jgi:hypothetical protein
MRRLKATNEAPTIVIIAVPIAKSSGAAGPADCTVSETLRAIAAVGAIIDIDNRIAWAVPSFLGSAVMPCPSH